MRTIRIRVLKWVSQTRDCEQDWWCERRFCSNVSKDAVCTKIRRQCAHPWHILDGTLSEVCGFMGLLCSMTVCRASSMSSLHLNLGMRAGGTSCHPVLDRLSPWSYPAERRQRIFSSDGHPLSPGLLSEWLDWLFRLHWPPVIDVTNLKHQANLF